MAKERHSISLSQSQLKNNKRWKTEGKTAAVKLEKHRETIDCDSVWFSPVTQPRPTHCDSMDCSTPGLPFHHQLLEFTHAQWVSDAILPSHPLLSPSAPNFNLSQNQGLFKWVSSSHQIAKVLEFQLQHQSFQWTPRTDFLQDGLVGSPSSPRDS